MGCGCKKNRTTTEGTNINTQISLEKVAPAQQNINLTAEQKKQIAEIADKINKINQ